MAKKINPFHELYVTESFGAEKFVKLFSNVIVEHSLSLFQPGHIVLKGLPGTGKSMLLQLLKPSIRIAYNKIGSKLPLPEGYDRFIGAGINLIRDNISLFSQRHFDKSPENNEMIAPLYFADYLNYKIVYDILNSITQLSKHEKIKDELNIDSATKVLDKFSSLLVKDNCWNGYFADNLNTFDGLLNSIKVRIIDYENFLQFNSQTLPENIIYTKTLIGIPISRTVHHLRVSSIIPEDVEFYVKIDQYEELEWLNGVISVNPSLGTRFQEIIHKLIGTRDSQVSYRIGTRHFAWMSKSKKIFGSNATIEPRRNYNELSIDDVLTRNENARTWIFPEYARDIYKRRILFAGFNTVGINDFLIKSFGRSFSPDKEAEIYFPNVSNREKAVLVEKEWPLQWNLFLKELAKKNPLSARLGEAWARQQGKGKIVYNVPDKPPYPWEDNKKIWWKKERIEQCLLQLASRNRQQHHWSGTEDLITLSGGNILAFLHLCKYIWEVWLRDVRNTDVSDELPEIEPILQSDGIIEASRKWFEDLATVSGGYRRQEFIRFLGNFLYKKLAEDISMSYPGANSFSIDISDLESESAISIFLKETSDYGDLFYKLHTSKTNKKKRQRWSLNPILSPYFKIPAAKTKEPYYITIDILKEWLVEAGTFPADSLESRKIRKGKIKDSSQKEIDF